MNKLYKYSLDCGRMGSIDGIFIADDAAIVEAIGKTADFGECLGKHSDIQAELVADDFTVASDDPEFIAKCEEILGVSISGFNPLDYLNRDDDEDADPDE